MKQLDLNAYAKINLAIDVLGKLPSGYHEVAMVMQQIELHDKVCVRWLPGQARKEEPGQRYKEHKGGYKDGHKEETGITIELKQ